MKKFYGILAVCLFAGSLLHAQETLWSGSLEGLGVFGTDEELPFWAYSNTFGRVEKESNFYMLGTAAARKDLARWGFIEAGAGVLLNNGGSPDLRADHYYVKWENYWFGVVAGKEQPELKYNGLSASDPSFLFSNNARPLPGVRIYTPRPLLLDNKEKWQLEADWAEYVLDDDRTIGNARVHTKSVNFIYNHDERNQVQAGFQHVALWDGAWPVKGVFVDGITDYASIFFGAMDREKSKSTVNGVGGDWNQMATYRFKYRRINKTFDIELFWDHLAELGPGMRMANFPDGKWGFYVQNKREEPMWDNFLYEFYYTRNQSDWKGENENYFNHGVYQSGWTYHNRVIGVPFFIEGENGIISNRFLVHHFGLEGMVGTVPYKGKLSYRRNYGLKDVPYTGPKVVLSGLLEVYINNNVLPFTLFAAGDYSQENRNAAFGVKVKRVF
ncbi:capsule assembly Wzi family protein [Robertkochia sediminum]|uniref:capsule assembly Wzi family protein n=1 Tax=Robertkochia sediminum TaxID=2785326 RepID=UPI0019343EF8|nr:capsule assembly Wzi family protein [Robertkochia sediminum]MBL7473750.1 hypothetical protein [Robertkochia sediminum]